MIRRRIRSFPGAVSNPLAGVESLVPLQSLQDVPNTPRQTRSGRFRALAEGATCPMAIFSEHQYATIGGTLSIPVGVASSMVLAQAGSPRNLLGFRNASPGAQNLFLDFGNQATVAGSWLQIAPGEMILLDTVIPQDDIYAIADAAGAVLLIAVSTTPGERC